MSTSARLTTRRWFRATRDRRIDDLAAAVTPQLLKRDVGTDGAVAEVTSFGTSNRK